MARMPSAPLRYTLMVARFPKIVSMEKHVGAFQEAIRHDYPGYDEHANQGVNASLGPEGMRLEWINEPIWQFADPARGHALILGTELLVLHAGPAYTTHSEFIDRFVRAATVLRDVPSIAVRQVHGLGFRYVDLVVPRPDHGETLAQYVAPWALPTDAPDLSAEGLRLGESAHVTVFGTERGTVRLQALRRPPMALPPDLLSPLVEKNGWVPDRPEGDFALLDIDHSAPLDITHPLDPDALRASFVSLRNGARLVFERASTRYAMSAWEGTA